MLELGCNLEARESEGVYRFGGGGDGGGGREGKWGGGGPRWPVALSS